MIPLHRTEIVEAGLARLTAAYRDKPNIIAILSALLKQSQELEDAAFDLMYAARLAGPVDPTGVYLDQLGKLVTEDRLGRSDGDYLQAIRARIRTNRSDGLAEDLIRITRLALVDAPFFYSEPAEATVLLQVLGLGGVPALLAVLRNARSGGVRGVLRYSEDPVSELFLWGSVSAGVGRGPESVSGGAPTSHWAACTDI